MATDPVCGMTVSSDSRFHEVHEGHTYLFCSEHCMTKFRAAPASYAAPASVGGVTYTCTMHPEVVRRGPGRCPKCGMMLVPAKS
jgi:Cu+-exporting ATPase